MPKAIIEPTPSTGSQPTRRRLFFGAALLPGLAAAAASSQAGAAPVASTHPDAHLLSLGAALDVACVALDQALAVMEVTNPDQDCDELPEWGVVHDLVHEIEETPLRSVEGALVKAKAIVWCRGDAPLDWQLFYSYSEVKEDDLTTDKRLVVSLVAGLCELAYPGAGT